LNQSNNKSLENKISQKNITCIVYVQQSNNKTVTVNINIHHASKLIEVILVHFGCKFER